MAKTAIVTGGSKGIGLGISKKLAAEGFNLVILGTSGEQDNQAALDELRAMPCACIYVQGSVDALSDHARLLDAALARFGRVDVLVNNAGVGPLVRNDLLDMAPESYDRVMGINLRGPLFLTQLVARQMAAQQEVDGVRGIIVNVSSVSANVASINRGEYCISKAGVSMMTSLFAVRMAEEKVFVYEVRPGIIETRMTAKVKDKYDALCESDALLVRRWGQPEDIANAVWAFCSGALLYCPGQVIVADGGYTLRRL